MGADPLSNADGARVTTVAEQWGVDFATNAGPGGFVRLARVGDRCWYWCYLVGAGIGLVAVRDHEVLPPRRPGVLEIRADALWAELVCETPGEHWGIGLEAFGVRLDRPRDAWTTEIGERLAVGLDLEWEVDAAGGPHGTVRGDVLLGLERLELDGFGVLSHEVSPDPPWPSRWTGWCRTPDGRWLGVVGGSTRMDGDGIALPEEARLTDGSTRGCEPLAVVPVPLRPGVVPGPALVRVLARLASVGDDRATAATGWVEVRQPERRAR